jgi:3-hydroxyacyl-CoA dehydrogenase
MIEKGMVGEKAGQGFYKRVKTKDGSEILTLDPATLEYRPKQPARMASIEAGKSIENTGERIKALYNAKDKAGDFLAWPLGPRLDTPARPRPTSPTRPAISIA